LVTAYTILEAEMEEEIRILVLFWNDMPANVGE
jgi:hypothetical protein